MGFLDEKGRIFGKVSLIDLAVVLVLVGAAVWFGYSMFGKNLKSEVAAREQETEIVVVTTGIRTTTAEAIAKGGRIFEFKTGACIGEVVSVSTEPAVVTLIEGGGKWVQMESPDRVNAFVTIKGIARLGENVITMSGVEIRVGGSLNLQTKFCVFQGHVMTMDLGLGGNS